MTKTFLAFGDSNTFGTPPMSSRDEYARYGTDERWACVAAAISGYHLIEEGLPGRLATGRGDPLMGPAMNGQLGLNIALASHAPIDVLAIMLGTNDLQTHHGLTAEAVTAGIAGLIAIAKSDEVQIPHQSFDILLICPPPVIEQGIFRETLFGAAEKSKQLAAKTAALAANWGIGFLDAGQHISSSEIDGIHLDADAQVALGHAVAKALGGLV